MSGFKRNSVNQLYCSSVSSFFFRPTLGIRTLILNLLARFRATPDLLHGLLGKARSAFFKHRSLHCLDKNVDGEGVVGQGVLSANALFFKVAILFLSLSFTKYALYFAVSAFSPFLIFALWVFSFSCSLTQFFAQHPCISVRLFSLSRLNKTGPNEFAIVTESDKNGI